MRVKKTLKNTWNRLRIFVSLHQENIFIHYLFYTMETQKLEWEIVPIGWAVCFNEECTRRNDCLRFQAGRLVPSDLCSARCVLPSAWKGAECKMFSSMKMEMYAWGFAGIYDKVLKKDFTLMRKQLTMSLQNKGYYYRYKRGELPLSPRQQQIIQDLFEAFGYDRHVKFDKMEMRYVFQAAREI